MTASWTAITLLSFTFCSALVGETLNKMSKVAHHAIPSATRFANRYDHLANSVRHTVMVNTKKSSHCVSLLLCALYKMTGHSNFYRSTYRRNFPFSVFRQCWKGDGTM